MRNIDKEYVSNLIPIRKKQTSKYDYGNILIIAGAGGDGMPGAAAFAALASVRSGAGLVRIATNKELFPVIQQLVPEGICIDISKKDEIISHLGSYDSIAIGPGMGVNKITASYIDLLFERYDGKLIIDADGINTVANNGILTDCCKASRPKVIMTPHEGEAGRLMSALGVQEAMERDDVARLISSELGVTCLLKGSGSIVANPDGFCLKNITGNPGMATAGSGDVLTGVITALCGQGLTPFGAAASGAYIHGLAGDLAAEELGEISVIARDIIGNLPKAFAKTLE